MADTVQGRRLTEAHRIAQVELGLLSVAASRVVWQGFSAAEIAEARDWLAVQVALLRHFDQRSAALATDYIGRYRSAEGSPGGPLVGVAGFNAGWAFGSMQLFGPKALLGKIDLGMLPAQAKDEVWGGFQGAVQRQSLQGGRRVVDESAIANTRSIGWRRVTDGDPCGFCAMLAGRGPKYRDAASAGVGRKYHTGCGCTAEEVFGDWEPTDLERKFNADYEAAAKDLPRGQRTQANVLPKMRELGYR